MIASAVEDRKPRLLVRSITGSDRLLRSAAALLKVWLTPALRVGVRSEDSARY